MVRAYLEVVRGRELASVHESLAEKMRAIVAAMERRAAEGYAAEADLQRFRAESARTENLLARVRIEQVRAEAALATLVGGPVSQLHLVRPGLPLPPTKVLLIGLMNFDPATDDVETISLQRQKKISRELLEEASQIKTGLKNSDQQQLKKLVSDIEIILLQIANLKNENNIEGIEVIKDGVSNRAIILKINIQEMKDSNNDMQTRKIQSQNGSKRN